MDGNAYRFDFARHKAGTELPPEHLADFQRLVKDLRYGGRFQLLIVECTDWSLREVLIRRLDGVLAEVGLTAGRIELGSGQYAEFADVEAELARLATQHHAVHVTGGESWFDDARMEAFNLRREAIAQACAIRLLLWLDEATVGKLAMRAPDWWAWRGGVFSFHVAPVAVSIEQPVVQLGPIDNRTLAKRSRRIGELRAFLNTDPVPPDELALPLRDELAGLLYRLGEWDEALRILAVEVLPACERLGDVRSKAVTQGKIADILQARGQLDEALRICTEEQLPVYERLGDVRSKAVTQGRIADILEARGQLDEALRIRTEEQLPVYERLGDVRGKSVVLFMIAQIELAREQRAGALAHLAESYRIIQQLQAADGLAAVGEAYGEMLCGQGEQARGLLVLESAFQAATQLGQTERIQRLRERIEALRA